MSAWEFELLDLAGVPVDLVVPRSVVLARNLNRASTLQAVLDARTSPEPSSTRRVLRGWRRPDAGGPRVLRASGRVISVQATASGEAPETLNVAATDGFGVLNLRLVGNRQEFTQAVPRDIVEGLLVQAGQDVTGLTLASGLGASGPPRDRSYEIGKNVGEAVTQLAEVDDGFYFRVDPLVDAAFPRRFSRMVLLYPEPGVDRPGARFEYGEGTLANLAEVQVDTGLPTNVVYAFGSGDGDDQLRAFKNDVASISANGPFEEALSHPDVVHIATLEQHALDALRPQESKVVRVRVGPPVNNPGLHLPTPWEDFDVGDTVRLNIRGASPALTYSGPALVTGFTVEVDAGGTERLAALDLQVT